MKISKYYEDFEVTDSTCMSSLIFELAVYAKDYNDYLKHIAACVDNLIATL